MKTEFDKVNDRIDKVEKAINATPLIQKDLSAISKTMDKMIKISEKQYNLESNIRCKDARNDEAYKRMVDRIATNEASIREEKENRKNDTSKLWAVWIWIARIIGGSIIMALLGTIIVKG